jgi:transcriptional regulator with XRE-family HTH domain
LKIYNLTEQRIIAGLSQTELGERIGVPHSSISAYETGRRGAHPKRIKELADALGCPVKKLIKKN